MKIKNEGQTRHTHTNLVLKSDLCRVYRLGRPQRISIHKKWLWKTTVLHCTFLPWSWTRVVLMVEQSALKWIGIMGWNVSHRNIARHRAHSIIPWLKPCTMAYASNFRFNDDDNKSTLIPRHVTREIGPLKTHSPISSKDNWNNSLNRRHTRDEYTWQAFYMFMLTDNSTWKCYYPKLTIVGTEPVGDLMALHSLGQSISDRFYR